MRPCFSSLADVCPTVVLYKHVNAQIVPTYVEKRCFGCLNIGLILRRLSLTLG